MRNRDADGKQLLVFEVKKHIKGVNNMNDMHRMFLYFLERVDREDSDGMVTIGEIFLDNLFKKCRLVLYNYIHIISLLRILYSGSPIE